MRDTWNRCDVCGKFIAFDHFSNGASCHMATPDSALTSETWEVLCIKHASIHCEIFEKVV